MLDHFSHSELACPTTNEVGRQTIELADHIG